MLTRLIRSLPVARPVLSVLGGAALAAGIVLATEARASALTLPYTFTGTKFFVGTEPNRKEGDLFGDFSLNCGAQTAESCVTKDLDAPFANSQFGSGSFSSLSISSLNPVTYTFDGETAKFITGIYGYSDAAQSYFLSFDGGTVETNSKERNILVWLEGTLPFEEGGKIGVTESVGTFKSEICKNILPPTANNNCPPGNTIAIDGFEGEVLTLVPSPFSITLLIPAAALLRLRRRYQPED